MVYLEPGYIGLAPFVYCWLKRVPQIIHPHIEKLQALFDQYLEVSFLSFVSFLFPSISDIFALNQGDVLWKLEALGPKLFVCFRYNKYYCTMLELTELHSWIALFLTVYPHQQLTELLAEMI